MSSEYILIYNVLSIASFPLEQSLEYSDKSYWESIYPTTSNKLCLYPEDHMIDMNDNDECSSDDTDTDDEDFRKHTVIIQGDRNDDNSDPLQSTNLELKSIVSTSLSLDFTSNLKSIQVLVDKIYCKIGNRLETIYLK